MTTTAQAAAARREGAARLRHLPSGALAEVLHLGGSLGALDLAGGVPGTPAPHPGLLATAADQLLYGDSQYEDTSGNLRLREQIAERLSARTDAATELTITTGASEALCVAMLAVVDPGDEVILLEPFYENFLAALATAGGVPKYVSLRSPEWRWDSAELARRSARAPVRWSSTRPPTRPVGPWTGPSWRNSPNSASAGTSP